MMMTSGEAVKYRSSAHAFAEIVKKEGTKSLFKGAGMLFTLSHLIILSRYHDFSYITTSICFIYLLYQVPTFSVLLPVLVCSLDTINSNSSSLERLTLAVVDNFCFECIKTKENKQNQTSISCDSPAPLRSNYAVK